MCSSAENADVNLVEQILEQGQKLRNAMVQSILNNDPFNTDVLHGEHIKYSRSHSDDEEPRRQHDFDKHASDTRPLSSEDKHRFVAYLRGEHMSKSDERRALQTLEEMSNADVCDATERSYSSEYSCNCDTCKSYYRHDLSCDLNHSLSVLCRDRQKVPPLVLANVEKHLVSVNNCQKAGLENLAYVDSLKVCVHSLRLNQEGNKKVYGSVVGKQIKLPLSISHTYFIEYRIPEVIMKRNTKSKSKVDSGLDSNGVVRMCSKKLHDEAVYFKQISLHDICISHEDAARHAYLKFQVSSRTLKQKTSNVIGHGMFHFDALLNSKYFTCNQELILTLNSDVPIVLGSIKVSLQLGCGQLYFGKEFIGKCDAEININFKLRFDILNTDFIGLANGYV